MHPVLRPEKAPFYRALCVSGAGAVWVLWAKRYRSALDLEFDGGIWTEQANYLAFSESWQWLAWELPQSPEIYCSHESQHREQQTERLCWDRARERKLSSLRIITVKGFTCFFGYFQISILQHFDNVVLAFVWDHKSNLTHEFWPYMHGNKMILKFSALKIIS